MKTKFIFCGGVLSVRLTADTHDEATLLGIFEDQRDRTTTRQVILQGITRGAFGEGDAVSKLDITFRNHIV